MENTSRRPLLAFAVLAIGLAATLSAWWGAGRLVEREARSEFASQAILATNILERRIQRYVDLLYGLEALTSHDEELNRREFSHYVAALDLGRRFPGVQAVELIRRVPDAQREAFVARVRGDRLLKAGGYPDFDIRPPGRRDEYWVIEFLEPASGTSRR
jgi:CHASE1-domain containing sensor protein